MSRVIDAIVAHLDVGQQVWHRDRFRVGEVAVDTYHGRPVMLCKPTRPSVTHPGALSQPCSRPMAATSDFPQTAATASGVLKSSSRGTSGLSLTRSPREALGTLLTMEEVEGMPLAVDAISAAGDMEGVVVSRGMVASATGADEAAGEEVSMVEAETGSGALVTG